MKVRELMTADARACSPTTTLAGAAATMWEADCGILPVVEDGGRIVGVITDRDVCIAAGTRARPASELLVADAMTTKVRTCSPDDSTLARDLADHGAGLDSRDKPHTPP